MAHEIFISYRKFLSKNEADILKMKIEAQFGKGTVFLDKDDIQVGDQWEDTLKAKLNEAKVVLIIISKGWIKCAWDSTKTELGVIEGQRRIDHPKDWVCREIQEAYLAKKAVAVHMGGAKTGEVNPSALTNPKFPEVKRFFESSQQTITISENCLEYEFSQIYNEIGRRAILKAPASPITHAEIRFNKKPNHKLTEYDCYCCNRDKAFSEATHFLRKFRSENHLHLFVPSQPQDAPESFIARIVHHHFPNNSFYAPDPRSAIPASSIKLVETILESPLDARDNIERDISVYSMPDYHENIVIFYRIDLKNWRKNDCKEFIHFISGIKLLPVQNKKFLFFFWLNTSGCPTRTGFWARWTGSDSQLDTLRNACIMQNRICFLGHLPPVEKEDLILWFSHRCENHASYPGFVESLFTNRQHINMAVIEDHLLQSFIRSTERYR